MDGTGADAALETCTRKFRRLPTGVRETLAYDQRKDMARHEELARRLSIQVYFADPRSP